MSKKLDFLSVAASEGIDKACAKHPNTVSGPELDALKGLSPDDLRKLREVREAMETKSLASADLGSGIGALNF